MVAALMPLARASPANSCFQAPKPAAELPHCAASACGIEHASTAKVTRVAVTSFLRWVIEEILWFCGAVLTCARQRRRPAAQLSETSAVVQPFGRSAPSYLHGAG